MMIIIILIMIITTNNSDVYHWMVDIFLFAVVYSILIYSVVFSGNFGILFSILKDAYSGPDLGRVFGYLGFAYGVGLACKEAILLLFLLSPCSGIH